MSSFCSHGADERIERRPGGDMQRREERQETGTNQTMLKGDSQVSHCHDETR